MKRYLCLLALALALSVGGLAAGHIRLSGAQDKLELGEQVLLGDPAAYGLTAACNFRDSHRRLFWDTAFTPGHGDAAETVFRFYASRLDLPRSYHPYVDLTSALSSQGMGREAASSLELLPDNLRRPVEDVASRTAPGGVLTETVAMADYYETYPLMFDASRDGYEIGWLRSEDGAEAVSQYFRLEMDPRQTAEITVKKYRDGSISTWDVYISQSWANLTSGGIITERGVYLLAASVDNEGRPDSRLHCRDGQGVHFIPAREDYDPAIHTEWYDASQICLFYPTEAEILDLLASPDEGKLLLYTRESDGYVLTVIDASTGGTLQRLELMDLEPEEEPLLAEQAPLYLSSVNDSGKFCLIAEENGVYSNVLHGVLEIPDYRLSQADSLAWDGEHLAFAVSHRGYPGGFPEKYPPGYIGVASGDGLLSLSRYDYSIQRDPCQRDYMTADYGSDRPALTVAFTGNVDEALNVD